MDLNDYSTGALHHSLGGGRLSIHCENNLKSRWGELLDCLLLSVRPDKAFLLTVGWMEFNKTPGRQIRH